MSTDDTEVIPGAADETRTDTAVIEAAAGTEAGEDDPTLVPLPAAETDAEPQPEPAPDRAHIERPWPFWDSMDAKERADGILPCGRCGTRFADKHAGEYPNMHDFLRKEAMLAGWDFDTSGNWSCPGCLAAPAAGGDRPDWGDGPGTEVYEQRLAQHRDLMAEIRAEISDEARQIHAHAETAQHEISLRIADVAAACGVRELVEARAA